MKTIFRMVLFCAASLCLPVVSAQAAEWGTLTGRFVYDGKAPAPAKLDVNKDPQVCGKHALYDESLVVADDGGLANVVLWTRTKDIQAHPDYAKTATDKAVLDNHDCRFEPHVLAMRVGQPLEVKNSDATGHNTNAALVKNAPFNVVIPANSAAEQKLTTDETTPATVTCNIHPWMKGYLLVRPDPYFAVSGKDGKFQIKNLPVGKHEFQVWHEKPGYVQKATLDGKPTEWKRGRMTVDIKPGANDLGEIKLSPEVFKK